MTELRYHYVCHDGNEHFAGNFMASSLYKAEQEVISNYGSDGDTDILLLCKDEDLATLAHLAIITLTNDEQWRSVRKIADYLDQIATLGKLYDINDGLKNLEKKE